MEKNSSEPIFTELYEKCIRRDWVTEEGSECRHLEVLLEETSHEQILEKYSINKCSGFSQAGKTKKIWKKEISGHRCQKSREACLQGQRSVSVMGAERVSWGRWRGYRLKDDGLCVQKQGVCKFP